MKIAISAAGKTLDSEFSSRFGRCDYFIIVDSDTEEWTAVANPGANASGGAGVQAAQIVANSGAMAVIGPSFGPKAFDGLKAAGITMYTAQGGSVRDVLAAYKAGKLSKATSASGHGHHHH